MVSFYWGTFHYPLLIFCLFVCVYLSLHYSVKATIPGFLSKGLSIDEGEKLLQRSVKLAIEARDSFWTLLQKSPKHSYNHALVAASIGSYGAYLADGSEYRCLIALLKTLLIKILFVVRFILFFILFAYLVFSVNIFVNFHTFYLWFGLVVANIEQHLLSLFALTNFCVHNEGMSRLHWVKLWLD